MYADDLGSTNAIPQYGLFEVTLSASEVPASPYLQMPGDNTTPGFVVGTFTGPNGEVITIDGFWDGGQVWKIRVAPTAVGKWTYTTSSTDAGLDGQNGSFDCVPSEQKGFVRVDPNHSHHFSWDDGTPFYWAPVAVQIAHFDEDGRDAQGDGWRIDDGSFQSFLDVRASQGFNTTHWGYYGFNKRQFNENTQRNEGGPPFVDYDPDRLNPSYYQYGDQRLAALLERGIIPQFTLGWPDQGIELMGHERLKRYWRYLIARYAAFNINYNLFGEADEFGSDWKETVQDYAALTRTWDPYDHLITTHKTGGPGPSDLADLNLDYIMLQDPTSETDTFLALDVPVINAEYGGYEDAQVDGEQLRPLIWDIRMRGGYFVYESWGNDLQSSGAQYASLNNLFFQDDTSFWLLEHHPELFGGVPGLADPGQEYVVYLEHGGEVTVDLSARGATPDFAYDVEWFNPRTGEITSDGVVIGGTTVSFNAPDANDWVLHLTAGAVDICCHIYLPQVVKQW